MLLPHRFNCRSDDHRDGECSRNTSHAVGMPAAAMSISDDAAVLVKNASDEADHIEVANVSNPVGPRINVAGNSFIVRRNTSAALAKMLGIIIGNVTRTNAWSCVLPIDCAASSRRGLICNSPDRKDPSATGRKSTA